MSIKKILAGLGITSFVFIAGLITLIFSPQVLYSNSYQYEQFTVHTEYEIEQDKLNYFLSEAKELVANSELEDADYLYDIVLAYNTSYNKIDDLIFGKWSAARAIDNNIIIKNKVRLEDGIVENGENAFQLEYVLAHEMTHCLQANKYGQWKFNPYNHPPMWKLEGYPEVVARGDLNNDEFDLSKTINDFQDLSVNNINEFGIIQVSKKASTPYIYFKGRIMIGYLMKIKGMSYDEILKDTTSEEAVYHEMIEWNEDSK